MVGEDVKRKLQSGENQIGIWGTGFIGFSTMAHYGNRGVRSVGYDVLPERVEQINDGEIPLPYDMESWLGFRISPLVDDGLVRATGDYVDLLTADTPIHFIAVPTEKDGYPWDEPLRETVKKISEYTDLPEEPVLLIIESTLTPGMTEDVVFPILRGSDLELGEDVVVGVAPRRDWFISPDKNLRTIPRVVGGQNRETTDYIEDVLEIVCEEILQAPDHQHGELIKSVENAYRHVGISLANQLARAYPDVDMREILQLVGTKWNVPTYYPSVGTGGYCVPVASQYVLSGTDHEEELGILHETIETDQEQPLVVADALAEHEVSRVAILGLAYKGDLRVDVLTPTVPISSRLQEHGIEVAVHDPFYDDEYIEERTGASSIEFPAGIENADAVLIVADHRQYDYCPHDRILEHIAGTQLVVDNHRLWEDIAFEELGVEYTYTGGEGWLTSVTGDYDSPIPVDSKDVT